MAFRLSDFGIPNYDTNVNVLYKNAVAYGESVRCGAEEYVLYHMKDTPLMVVLRFLFKEDGETPERVIAHTFLDNAVHWQDGVQEGNDARALILRGGAWLKAEIINPSAAGSSYTPMLFADSVRFGPTRLTVGADMVQPEGVLVPAGGDNMQLLARVVRVQPVVMSKLWLFSVVELALDEGTLCVPVSRDVLEKQLSVCNEGDLCFVSGQLSLLKAWS